MLGFLVVLMCAKHKIKTKAIKQEGNNTLSWSSKLKLQANKFIFPELQLNN